MVSRRFAGPSRTLTERLRARATATRDKDPRADGTLASRAQDIIGERGGAGFSAVGRGFDDMMNHKAVGFGRAMTASPAQGQIDGITGNVRGRLAEAGIYKDDLGTFQISGMERTDPSRAIRDAAIAAMDPTGEVARRVAFSEGQLNSEGGWARPNPVGRSNTAELAIPGVSDVMTSRVNEVGKPPDPSSFPQPTAKPAPPVTKAPQPTGKPPAPNLPSGTLPRQTTPGTLPRQTTPPAAVVPGSVGTIPGRIPPGTQVSTPAGGKPPAPTPSPFPPQGQGVGRTSTPTGAEIDPSKYPTTSGGVLPQQTSYMSDARSQELAQERRTSTQAGSLVPQGADIGQLPKIFPQPSTGTPGQLPRQGGEQGKPPGPNPAPTGGTPGTLPRQGPGTPGQTPTTPGQTTASRPGGAWPTQKLGPFGTDDGGTSMFPPGFPFNGRQTPGAQGTSVGLEGLSQSIQQRVQEALGGVGQRQAPAAGLTPIPGLEGLGDRIRAVVEQGQRDIQGRMPNFPGITPGGITPGGGGTLPPQGGPQTAPQPAPGGTIPPQGPQSAPAPTGGGTVPTESALGVADMIILQESGGAPPTPNNLNCEIRPSAGCLDLNTGIFKVTADEYGLDWNRLVAGDAEYGRQAVAQLMTGYAQDDASKWNGPSGMTVWEYGEQNLPGGGWEAVGRVYFGGDVTGSFVDEQGRSGVTYGQQFIEKLNNAGIPTGPGTGVPGTETQSAPAPIPGDTPKPPPPDINGLPAPSGSFTLPPLGQTIQMPDASAQQIVDIAQLYVGLPYMNVDEWQQQAAIAGSGNPGRGIDPRQWGSEAGRWDCSGFVYWLDQNYGDGTIPEGSHEQYNYFYNKDPQGFTARNAAVTAGDYSSLKPGDIVYMDTNGTVRGGNEASHVAVYIGNGQFINAANDSEGTTIWNGLNGYQVLGVATAW